MMGMVVVVVVVVSVIAGSGYLQLKRLQRQRRWRRRLPFSRPICTPLQSLLFPPRTGVPLLFAVASRPLLDACCAAGTCAASAGRTAGGCAAARRPGPKVSRTGLKAAVPRQRGRGPSLRRRGGRRHPHAQPAPRRLQQSRPVCAPPAATSHHLSVSVNRAISLRHAPSVRAEIKRVHHSLSAM